MACEDVYVYNHGLSTTDHDPWGHAYTLLGALVGLFAFALLFTLCTSLVNGGRWTDVSQMVPLSPRRHDSFPTHS